MLLNRRGSISSFGRCLERDRGEDGGVDEGFAFFEIGFWKGISLLMMEILNEMVAAQQEDSVVDTPQYYAFY